MHTSQLRDWVKKLADDPQHAFPGQGQMKPEQLEIARLKREKRSLIGFYATTFLFTIAGIFSSSLQSLGGSPALILKFMGLPMTTETLLAILRRPILFGTIVVMRHHAD